MHQLSPNQDPQTHEVIQSWLMHQLADQLQIDPEQVDPKAPFDSYGLSSSQVLSLAVKSEKQFGFKIPPTLLWHYPNIESLSLRLVEEFATAERVFEI